MDAWIDRLLPYRSIVTAAPFGQHYTTLQYTALLY